MRLFNIWALSHFQCPNIRLLNPNVEESLPNDFQIQMTKHIIRNKYQNKYLPDNLHIQIISLHFSHLRQDLHWTNKPSFTFVCRVDASFKKKYVHNSTITWSQPPSQSPSWCSCPGSCRREQQHVHARPPVGQESPQAHLWKSQSEKMLLTSSSPSIIVFGVFGVGVFTFGIFASFGNDEKYGWSCKWDRYVLIF